jgi:hypothetical protein
MLPDNPHCRIRPRIMGVESFQEAVRKANKLEVSFCLRLSAQYCVGVHGTDSNTSMEACWSPIAWDATYRRLSWGTNREVPEPGLVLILDTNS